jgi:hypothetical protein
MLRECMRFAVSASATVKVTSNPSGTVATITLMQYTSACQECKAHKHHAPQRWHMHGRTEHGHMLVVRQQGTNL